MWERNMDIVLYVIYESKYTYYQKDQEKRNAKQLRIRNTETYTTPQKTT